MQASLGRLRTIAREYVRVFADYRLLLACGVLLLLPSLLLPIMPGVTGCTTYHLCSSRVTPWGVLTSVFVYDGWQNATVFFGLAGAYLPFSSNLDSKTRRVRSKFISVAMFAVAVVANAIWAVLAPFSTSFGQSGVVYAAWGLLVAFCVVDMLPRGAKGSWMPRFARKDERYAGISNLVVVAATLGFLFSNPGQFLSEGPGINAFVHAIAFIGGYFSAYVYRYTARVHMGTYSHNKST